MSDINLNPIGSGFNRSRINNNFEVIEEIVNNGVLHLEGGNNIMKQNLDMNSKRILNLPNPDSDGEPVPYGRLLELLGDSGNAVTVPLVQPRQVGDGTATVFSAPSSVEVAPEALFVFIDGVKQRPVTDYTVNGTGQVVFTEAPALNTNIDITFYTPLLDTTGETVVVATGTTTPRTLAERFADIGFSENEGSVGDGVTDDTVSLQSGIDKGVLVLKRNKTYMVSGLTLTSNLTIKCIDGFATIKLIDNSNAHTLFGQNVNNIHFENIIIDGNKDNQSIGSGNNWRGIYLLDSCKNISGSNVIVRDTVDHGFFMSDSGTVGVKCGEDSSFLNVWAHDCGSQAHLDAGGAGGSGLVGGHETTTWNSCGGTGNRLNAMKARGKHIACVAKDNIGGGMETGFGADEHEGTSYSNCFIDGNGGGGIRNLGQIDRLDITDCFISNNGEAGITIVNNVKGVNISGGTIKNNGKNGGVSSDTVGYSGVYISATSGLPEDITISGVLFDDDQSVKTQQYSIQVNKPVNNLVIDKTVKFKDSLNGDTFISPSAAPSNIVMGGAGLDYIVADSAEQIVTGTTAGVRIVDLTIPARATPDNSVINFSLRFKLSGALGNKIIRIGLDSSTKIALNTALSDDEAILIGSISHLGTVVFCEYKVVGESSINSSDAFVVPLSKSNDLNFFIEGQLTDAADSIIKKSFSSDFFK